MTVTIRSTTNPADVFDGPDDAKIPSGYEKVPPQIQGDGIAATLAREAHKRESEGTLAKGYTRSVAPFVLGTEKPKDMGDVALMAIGNAPLIAAGGMGAAALSHIGRLGAPLGRIATSVALAKGRGEDNTTAAIEGIGATGAEVGAGLVSKMVGGPARAMAAIREIIGKGPDGPVNVGVFNALIKRWSSAATAPAKTIAAGGTPAGAPGPASRKIQGIVPFLEEEDPTGIAALMFKDLVAKGTKIPFKAKALPPVNAGLSQVAEGVLTSPMTRGATDAAMSADPTPGALTGDLAVMGADRAMSAPGAIMRLLK